MSTDIFLVFQNVSYWELVLLMHADDIVAFLLKAKQSHRGI